MEYREEQDSLGVVLVPKDARFGSNTQRALQNFAISGRHAHPALIRSYLWLKRAAAVANAATGALDEVRMNLIVQAIDELLSTPESEWPEFFPVDVYQAGAGTSQNMNINEVIANTANLNAGNPLGTYKPVHPNDHVNCSQSTNDSFPTAMRIAILIQSRALMEELDLISEQLEIKSRQWMNLPKSARTHLQDAVPMTLGQEVSAYSVTLRRCLSWLQESRIALQELGIGGSAAGTGLNVPEGYQERIIDELSRLSQEPLRDAENLFESMQSQSPILYYSSSLRVLASEVGRICNDLRLLSSGPSTGLAELLLPAVQPGSSIMPGKVNPSILEMANQACFSVIGYDQTTFHSVQAGQLELNVMMPIMAYSLLEATTVMTQTLRTLRTRCIEGLEANEARLRYYFENTPQVATALNPLLGYHRVAELVQESLAEGISILEKVRKEKLIPEETLQELLDVKKLTGQKK